MGVVNKSLVEQTALQMAFIAISSRIVGSAFRCLETLNPQYQQSKVISDPRTVCIRELSTISMAWCFALITSKLITPRARQWGWSNFKIQFLTSVIGTAIAESIGRMIAYREKLNPPNPSMPYAPSGGTLTYGSETWMNSTTKLPPMQRIPMAAVNRTGMAI